MKCDILNMQGVINPLKKIKSDKTEYKKYDFSRCILPIFTTATM